MAFITPNAWLSNKYAKGVRTMILDEYNLLEIINFNQQIIFEDAQVETSIFIICKKKPFSSVFVGHLLSHKYIFNKDLWKTNENYIINFSENPILQNLLDKINSTENKLSDIFDISNGCKPYQVGYGKNYNNEPFNNENVKNRIYHSKTKETEEYFEELRGKHIQPYFTQHSLDYIKWGNWLMSPKERKYHFQPKILIRQIIGKSFIASIDYNKRIADQTLYICIPQSNNQQISLEFALGVFNSKLYGFYFRKFYSEEDDLFPKIKVNELKRLPFKIPSREIQTSIEAAVKEILLQNSEMIMENQDLRDKIDHYVYQLYELTKKEIKIVEESA